MRKLNVILIAALLALAVVLGTVAASRTISLGASATATSASTLDARAKKLDAFETSLDRALARKPPALPVVPKPAAAAPAPRVVYRRPPPVVTTHAGHDDEGYEHDGADHDGVERGDD